MGHHSRDDEMVRELAKQLKESLSLGATRRFPDGKMHWSDEGELRLAIFAHEGKVVINFGSPVSWIGFDAEQAEAIAASLIARAEEARQ